MTNFPEYKTVLTKDLIPYARNSRTHSDAQVAKIASSIREFGFLNPIITDGDNGIIAGHGRVLAAQKLGLGVLPCIEASHLTTAQRRAYVIADNRLALDAGWDNELLRVELDELKDVGFDLSLTGFDVDEVEAISFDPDAVKESFSPFVKPLGCDDEVEKENRQGSSPWSRVQASDTVRAMIGDVEFSVSKDASDLLKTIVSSSSNAKAAAREIIENAIFSH